MQRIGKYDVVRLIGEGGMGRVYEASDPVINRRVAIKTISQQVLQNAGTRARFLREAQAAGQLNHPNLITIHDVGEDNGMPFIVMEYLEGQELTGIIAKERLALEMKLQVIIDACQGLSYAHGKGLVHRDIKPANIFVTNLQQVKILDFGLARGLVSDLTETGNVVGTPSYMAPEQVRGEPIDRRADIFSIGVVLYELLSGRKPFKGDSVAALIYQVLQHDPQPLDQLDRSLPRELTALVTRALAKDTAARYQTVDHMLADLQRVKGSLGSTLILKPPRPEAADAESTTVRSKQAMRVPTPQPISQPLSQPVSQQKASPSRVVIGAAAVGLAAAALLLAASRFGREPAPPATPQTRTTQATASPATDATAAPAPRADAAPTPSQAETSVQPRASAPATTTPAALTESRNTIRPNATPPAPQHAEASTRRDTDGAPGSGALAATVPASGQSPASAPTVAAEHPVIAEPPRQAAPPPPAPAPASAPPITPVSVPVPAASAPAAAPASSENAAAAVNEVLARYKAALEARSLAALRQIWPSLAGRQEAAIQAEFDNARAIAVTLNSVTPVISNDTATVTSRREYIVTTTDRRTLSTATRMTMTLERRNGAWLIQNIRHDAAR